MNFNEGHYRAVFRERRNQGIERKHFLFLTYQFLGENGRLDEHLLYGKRVQYNDGKIGIIECVNIHWYYGYYLILVYRIEGTKSHGTIFWENINCIDKGILDIIKETQKDWKLID